MDAETPRSLQEELDRQQPFDCLEQETYLNLAGTHGALLAGLTQLFRDSNLTKSQYNALCIIAGAKRVGIRCDRIAAQMISRDPDVTRLVDRLQKAGLASRRPGRRDRRVVFVTITTEGRALLDRLYEPVLNLHREQLRHLGPRKIALLNELLFEARHPPKGHRP